MIRKIAVLFFTIFVGAILYFGYQKIQSNTRPRVNIYDLVPTESLAILEISEPFAQWNDLITNNIIWDELQIFKNVENLNRQIHILDSALQQTSEHILFSENNPLIISLIPNNKDSSKGLYPIIQTTIDEETNLNELERYLKELFVKNKIQKLPSGLIFMESESEHTFFSLHQGVLSFCNDSLVLNNVRNQFNSGTSILTNSSFTKVKNTSSKNAVLRLFVDPLPLLKALKPIASSKSVSQINLIKNIGNWIELDVEIKPDEISMGGFLTANDTNQHWISLFENQESIKPQMVRLLPDRTAFMFHVGFSNYLELRKKWVSWKASEKNTSPDEILNGWNKKYEASIKDDFLQWIDNEIALVIVEPDQMDFHDDIMVWVSSTDAEKITSNLSNFCLKVDNENQNELYSITFKEHTINKLNLPDFLSNTLGDQFQLLQDNYFTQIEDYIVFANSPATLQWTINRIEAEKTLEKDPNYQAFENRISAESNIFIYSNIGGSLSIYKNLVNNQLQNEVGNYAEWLQKFQVASVQLSYESDDLYYMNAYCRYNPVYKKESSTIWEFALDNPVRFKPTMVKNHYTNATEIFIQDTGNVIYLISNKGKVLWKKQLDEEILSEVAQIDVFKNNKLQLTFNTQNKIYIIDRNGKNLSNFPISLPNPASANMAILDYDNNKDYRFLIPTINGEILNYTVNGIQVNGWEFSPRKELINQKIQHINVKGKDYNIVVYDNGKVEALDRKGSIRIKLKEKFNFSPIGSVYVHGSSELSSSYVLGVTKNKEVVKISLADKKTRLFEIGVDHIKFLSITDGNGAAEIIVTDSNRVVSYKTDGNIVFDFKTKFSPDFNVNVYKFDDHILIGYVSSSQNQIFLSTTNGDLVKGFPLNGSSPFSINDINADGRFNVVTVSDLGLMFAYTYEN